MTVTINASGAKRKFDKILKSVADKNTYRKLGFFVIETVQTRTRKQGKGVKRSGGTESTLKPVSAGWAKQRLRYKRHPEAATGRRSNLTFQGSLLNKGNMVIKRADSRGVFIGFRLKKDEDKAEGQANQGRIFMNLSNREILRATDFLKAEILRSNK